LGEEIPNYVHNMIPWGWAGVVKTKNKISAKLNDKGTVMMMVGYPDNHAGDSYRMFNDVTKRIVTTRDIAWLDRMFYSKEGNVYKTEDDNEFYLSSDDDCDNKVGGNEDTSTSVSQGSSTNEGSNEKEVIDMTNDSDNERNDNATGTTVSRRSSRIARNASEVDENTSLTPSNRVTRSRMRDGGTTRRSGRVSRPTPKFTYGTFGETGTFTTEEIDYYNALVVLNSFNDTNQAESEIVDQLYEVAGVGVGVGAGVGAGTGNNFGNTAELKPMKYKEAMKCDDKKLWEEAVDEEYRKFEKYKVFKPVKKDEVPKDAKFVTTTWAMKRKSNGVRRARMNMRGYEQEENVHYDPSSTAAPVTNDVTIRMMLT